MKKTVFNKLFLLLALFSLAGCSAAPATSSSEKSEQPSSSETEESEDIFFSSESNDSSSEASSEDASSDVSSPNTDPNSSEEDSSEETSSETSSSESSSSSEASSSEETSSSEENSSSEESSSTTPSYGAYYASITENMTKDDLFYGLRTIISHRTNKSYDDLYTTYESSDSRPDGKVNDYYSNITNYRHITDKAGNYKNEGDVYNREHSIPQSWFKSTSPNPKSDPFIVFPTDGKVNGMRSSYSFGEVDRNNISYASKNNYSLLGGTKYRGYGPNKVFEPNDKWKGDFARAYFYGATCYSTSERWTNGDGRYNFSSGRDFVLTEYATKLFIKWHLQDPVDAWEIHRNDAIQAIYKNRNPYIDHPEWATKIWGTQHF